MIQQGGNAVDGAIAAAAVMTDRRAVQQRPRLGRLLHPLGRQEAARPERLGPGPGGVDAGVLPQEARRRRGPAAGARLGLGDGARRRRRVGRALRAVRQIAVRRPARAGDRDRRARLRGAGHRPAEVGRGGAAARRAAGLGRGVPAAWPAARGRRALRVPGRGARAEGDRRDARRRALRRRDRRGGGGAFARQRRRDGSERLRRVQAGVGRADRHRHLRPSAARDSAQRAGHRGAGRARHPAPLRHRVAADRRRRVAAPADRGDEARLRRRLRARLRLAQHALHAARRCSTTPTSPGARA